MIDHDELRARSNLPGPLANLELVRQVADTGTAEDFRALVATGDEFLVMCGAVGYGSLLAAGDRSVLPELRRLANDERWRVREAVAMALQRWGHADFDALADEVDLWAAGTPLERRAAAAALCEPRLLTSPERVVRALAVLVRVSEHPRGRTLRKRSATAGASRSPDIEPRHDSPNHAVREREARAERGSSA